MNEPILGVQIFSSDYYFVVASIVKWTKMNESRCVYATSVHGLMEAQDDKDFLEILNDADINTPDGMPLVWILRLKGHPNQQRVYGPTLMLQILQKTSQENIPVGFYGGAPKVLERLVQILQRNYPHLKIVYSYSPPFRQLSKDEDEAIIKQIQDAGVRVLLVGLGCPKQERWMAAHRGRIPAVMVGVGAAFDFHAGSKRQAPVWMQRLGLEWFFRLTQEPKRLLPRYLKHNPRFMLLALAELLGIRLVKR
jgi:N-acetylglucosaminyldiphosphoundecaprenol N-acetyl-beta-D-mannosaminyltransferase